MANKQAWIDIVNQSRTEETKTIKSFEEMQDYFSSKNMKLNIRDSNTYKYGPLTQNISKSTSSAGVSSTKNNALVNVRVDATNAGNNRTTIKTISARSEDPNGDLVKTGIVHVMDTAVVAAICGVCGYSLGWKIATSYAEGLVKDDFDWGYSSTASEDGHVEPMLIGSPSGGNNIRTYIDYDVFKRIVKKLDDYGLWEIDPQGQVAIDPVIGVRTNYDFNPRFPNIPEEYVYRCVECINTLINQEPHPSISSPDPIDPRMNEYLMVSILDDGTVNILIVESHNLNVLERNSKINNEEAFEYSEEPEVAIKFDFHGDFTYMYKYVIEPDGQFYKYGNYWDGFGTTTIHAAFDKERTAMVWDNFGTEYRPIEWSDPSATQQGDLIIIDDPVDDWSQIVIDPDKIDLRDHTIEDDFPSIWGNRILVSCPVANANWHTTPNANDLKKKRVFIPITIRGSAIDPNSTQLNSLTGDTDPDLFDEFLDDTPKIIPRIGGDPDVDNGDVDSETPPVPTLPDGIGTFISIYEISETNLTTFANRLWSMNISDWLPILTDPMDAVIGMHLMFCDPATKSSGTHLKLGNLEYNDIIVDEIKQYKTLECGYVEINKRFNNINDYVSTKIQLYLPFIGYIDLQPSEVIGKLVYVDYNIDFLTGACVAFVTIKTDTVSGPYVAYSFTGNCAVEIPITGMDYANVCRNVIQAAGNIVSGAATGGLAGAAMGAVQGVGGLVASEIPIERSGNLGSNAGAMGIKKPFIIITRNYSADATDRQKFEGLPSNKTLRLGTLSGYTRVKFINLEGLNCTEEEKADIIAKLQEGVII